MNRTLASAQKLVNTNSFYPTDTGRSSSGSGNGVTVNGVSQDYSKAKSLHKPKALSAATTSASKYKSGSMVPASALASTPKRRFSSSTSSPVDPTIKTTTTSSLTIDPLPETLPRFSSPTSQRQNQTTWNPSLASFFPTDSLFKSKVPSSGPLSITKMSNSGVTVSFVKPTFGGWQPSLVQQPASPPSCKLLQTAAPCSHPFRQQRLGPVVAQPLPPIKGAQRSEEDAEHSVELKQVILLKDDKLGVTRVHKEAGRESCASRPSMSMSRSTSHSPSRNSSRELLACSEAGTTHSEYAERLDVRSPLTGWPLAKHYLPLLLAQYAEQLSTLRGVPWQGAASANNNLLLLRRLQDWGGGQEKGARGRLAKLAGGKKNLAQSRVSPLVQAQSRHQTDSSSTCLDKASNKAVSLKADHKV